MTTQINIITGFLGVGKTTLLKKILPHIGGEVAIIENEFGEVDIDGEIIGGSLPIQRISSGCICCSVSYDLKRSIQLLIKEHGPDYIFIEPSGVASLTEVQRILSNLKGDLLIGPVVSIVDIEEFEDCLNSMGTFYLDQIKNSDSVVFSNFKDVQGESISRLASKIRAYNKKATIVEEDWYKLDGDEILKLLNLVSPDRSSGDSLTGLEEDLVESPEFESISILDPLTFSENAIQLLKSKLKSESLGKVLRAKGIVKMKDGRFLNFNYTPQKWNCDYLKDLECEKVVVIGEKMDKASILSIFKGGEFNE